jgi:hypothetical protein
MSGSNEVDLHLLAFARQVAAIPRRISEEDEAFVQNAVQGAPLAMPPVAAAPTAVLLPDIAAMPNTATTPTPVKQIPKAFPEGQPARSIEFPKITDKKIRTPDELAGLIMTTLREVGDCPDQGFLVTVYGCNPWNAMLMIRPEAGPRIDRTLWLSRVQDITARLRSEFDIADERPPP